MPTSIDEFLDKVIDGAHIDRFARITGSIRFDLTEDGRIHHRLVSITSGKIKVSRENRPADCVVHGDKALLDAAVRGERNVTAAWLRHSLVLDGRIELFRLLEREFPGPPTGRDPRHLVSHRPGEDQRE